MYVREWALDPLTGAWKVMHNSGWIDFSPTYTWQLSAGQGVRYVGVWVADVAGNISTLEEPAMPFANRVDESQVLADGQRIQYRALLETGKSAWASLKTVSGDSDLYAWGPHNAFLPDRSANATLQPGQSEELETDARSGSGRYILEVQAVGASEYDLSWPGRRVRRGSQRGAREAAARAPADGLGSAQRRGRDAGDQGLSALDLPGQVSQVLSPDREGSCRDEQRPALLVRLPFRCSTTSARGGCRGFA